MYKQYASLGKLHLLERRRNFRPWNFGSSMPLFCCCLGDKNIYYFYVF